MRTFILCLVLLFLCSTMATAGALSVVAVSPSARSLNASSHTDIRVTFDRAVDPATVSASTFRAFGRWSGSVTGVVSLEAGNTVAVLTPADPLSAGEQVMVVVANTILGADTAPLRAAGYSYQFWVESGASDLLLTERARMTTRTLPEETSRAYGGFATDLDNDGYLDITIVNEDTSDLRVFSNQGDGLFAPFLTPTSATGSVPSPSEPADFDGDGDADIAVANTAGGSVSILLGNGDGTFGAQQEVSLGSSVRGIAVLDVNGDAHVDIAASTASGSTFAVLLNDGSGVFSAPSFIGPAGGNPWGLAAADMNNDGVLDLVSATRDSQQLRSWISAGEGTFTAGTAVTTGNAWMLAVGDLNGDGHEDVSVASSFADVGTIHFGDGTGTLGARQDYPTDSFPLATDIGDLDGDGDLDWIIASFGGDWQLFLNDGQGLFTLDRAFAAPQAASCSLMVDLNNDGVLDLALIDELEDEVIVLHNTPHVLFADGFETGDVTGWDATSN